MLDMIKILVAVILGAIIGFEREQKEKPLGLRTIMIASLGSCLITLTIFNHFPQETGRILAGIITGIGFLGAGAIIANKRQIQGLTSAITVWTVAVIGAVVGLGDFYISTFVSMLIFLILKTDYIEKKLRFKTSLSKPSPVVQPTSH